MATENISKRLKMCNDSKPDTIPSSLNIIANIWQSIEPFILLEDTISASKCCNTLHDIIIDSDTKKVKVTHFTSIRYYRIVDDLSWAINTVHFPSLKKLRYPLIREGYGEHTTMNTSENIEKEIVLCFPMIAAYLSQACNLESFTFDAERLIFAEDNEGSDNESSGTIRRMFSIFGMNLANCRKLKELTLINKSRKDERGRFYDYNPDPDEEDEGTLYSTTLLEAITPTIINRRDDLERLTIEISGDPTNQPDEYDSDDSDDEEDDSDSQVANDFFAAVLATKSLIKLSIDVDRLNVINELLKVAGKQYTNLKKLKTLDLTLALDENRDEVQPADIQSVTPLLKYFSDCHSLQSIHIKVPREAWGDVGSLSALRNLFIMSFNCDYYSDNDGKVLHLVKDLAVNNSCMKKLALFDLKDVRIAILKELVPCFQNDLLLSICDSDFAGVGLPTDYTTGVYDPERARTFWESPSADMGWLVYPK